MDRLADLSPIKGRYRLAKIIQLMKIHLSQRDVFLAIDNVWESSSEWVKRILDAGFSANSKILLTSRSDQVLQDLLRGRNNACVRPLPALEHDEAFQIFQDAFGGDDKSLENCRDQLDRIIKRFVFAGNYHALALKALGGYVREGCTPGDSKKNKDFLEQTRPEDLGKLENAIRLSYDILPEHRKHLFLDIAVLRPILWELAYGHALTDGKAHQFLSVLYKDQLTETKIVTLIYKLALDGLVQLETDGCGERIIRVHDLIADLAHREAATSSRFFITGRSNKPVEEIEWKKLERVLLSPGGPEEMNSTRFIEKAQQQECRKLQVLYAAKVDFLMSGIDMRRMPSLCVLCLRDVTLGRIQNWSAASKLAIVLLSGINNGAYYDGTLVRVFNLNALIQLRVLHVKFCYHLERIEGLDSLKNLRSLSVQTCHFLENLDGLSALPQLKALQVACCKRLKKMPDLSRLTCLEKLVLEKNKNMEGVGGCTPAALKIIRICDCDALKSTPDLSGSTHLEALKLSGNRSLEEVQGVLSSTLTDLYIHGYPEQSWLKKIPDLSGLTNLDSLELCHLGMEELGGLSSTIRIMDVSWCPALKRMPDLSGLTRLVSLQLHSNKEMEVGCLSSTLKDILIEKCALKKMPDLSGLTRLDELVLEHNVEMEEVGCLSSTLKKVQVYGCRALKKMPDLSGLTRLDELLLSHNVEMEEVGCLSSTLKKVEVYGCCDLKKMPDLSGLTRLESLALVDNNSMEEVGGQYVSSTLKELKISRYLHEGNMRVFPSLKDCIHLTELTASADALTVVASSAPPNLHTLRLIGGDRRGLSPSEQWKGLTLLIKELILVFVGAVRIIDLGYLSPLVNLKSLTVSCCYELEEIANSGELQGLERLTFKRCRSLKKLDGFRDIQTCNPGEVVHFQRCPSREGIHWSIINNYP